MLDRVRRPGSRERFGPSTGTSARDDGRPGGRGSARRRGCPFEINESWTYSRGEPVRRGRATNPSAALPGTVAEDMLAKLFSYTLVGIDAASVEVEVDAAFSSMPKTVLVGLAE